MPVVYHTPESLAEWQASTAADPAMAKLRDLTVEYVQAQGGLVLDVWRHYMGQWFGEPWMMTLNEVGARLGISENHAENIVRATDAVVVPKWRRTEEFRNSVYGLAPSGLAWPSGFRRVTSMTS
jgi:hypothetical protein